MINIDTWIGGYKVRAFNWIDNKRIFFNVLYYGHGRSIERDPVWDKTVYITDNEAGRNIVLNFTHSLVEHIAKMQIKKGIEVTITV